MQGKIVDKPLFKGFHEGYSDRFIRGKVVNIVDTEDHKIYGKRYKIEGCDDWFEANCFEWIK